MTNHHRASKSRLISVSLFALSFGSVSANAAGLFSNCYSYPAVAMTPYDKSIQANQYRMTHERVYHNQANTGLILLYGPVAAFDKSLEREVFRVHYKDPDGVGADGSVSAELRFVDYNGRIHIISRLRSNDASRETDEVQDMATSIQKGELNRRNGYYVVRVYISRASTEVTPVAIGYELCSVVG